MYLKSIEVQGFKSFANKMVFKFNKGITGIVGPNGSGKSNVADAVRWVLGEQSAKQLRSSKMEDVIFSGTETRKPLGFAYVAITMDNSDHKLPVEYDEVTVARRVYRSGESEYLLNGHNCRLKDVQEMFFDTGIGKEGYSIIGQGQIDKILSGKPEERRELFDEAAGIVKFKKRKQTALKNLDIEKQNLYRVNDILTELEKQVGPLKRQEETARVYLKLRDELKVCDVNMFLLEYARIREQLKELEGKSKIVADDLEQTTKNYENTRTEYEKLEGELEALDAQLEQKRSQMNEGRLNKEKLDGEIKVLNEQINSTRQVMANNQARILQLEAQIKDKNENLEVLAQQKDDIDAQIAQIGDEQSKADSMLEGKNANVDKLRQTIDARQGDIIEYLNEAANVRGKIGRYDTMVDQINIRKSELNQRLIVLKSEENANQDSLKLYEEEYQRKTEEIKTTQGQQQTLTKRNQVLAETLMNARKSLDGAQQEYHKVNSRYAALRNISERYEGFGGSVKKIMEKKAENPGVIGVVADIFSVDKRYETAIEIALGGSIQNIVTEDEQTSKAMIQYLKQNRLGRATFLPLTSVKAREHGIDSAILKEKGVIGTAAELAHCDARFVQLKQYLLGRIVVTEHIDGALALAAKYKYSLRIVTLEGELLNPGGSMSGGAYKNSSNLLGRRRELDALVKQIEKLKADIQTLNNSISQYQTERDQIKKDLNKLAVSLQELSLEENTLRMNLNQVKKAAQNSVQVYAELTKEEKQLQEQIAEIHANKEKLKLNLTEYDSLKKNAEDLIEQLNEKLQSAIEDARQFGTETSGIRLKANELTQKQQFAIENMRRIKGEIRSLNEDIEQIKVSDAEKAKEAEEKLAVVASYRETSEHVQAHVTEEEDSLKVLMQQREGISVQHKAFFTQREEMAERISVLDKENFRLSHQIENLNGQKMTQSNYMWEEYELTFNSALDMMDDTLANEGAQALKKRINELKGQMKALGNVNVNAIEEYKTISERYELLKTQHDDLVEAEAKLTGIIESLDNAMRTQFTEKFKLIQQNFNRVFKELFGGGKGSLELTEDEDILYAGIRIIASPPGKKLQNMMQMSGGEKALTAIALLFAIQSLKPSPFCLLDEIEAALDDANVKRYAQYLNNLTKDTQFIIITHRRGTMNAADVLYGITMQEKGVSTLVSVNLIDSKLDD